MKVTKICIIGNMGSGKTSIFNYLRNNPKYEQLRDIVDFNLEYTTRPMRESEKDNSEYKFISEDVFDELEYLNLIKGVTKYKTIFGDFCYGSNRNMWFEDRSSIIVTNPDAVIKLKNDPEIKYDIKVICLMCPKGEVTKRLSYRSDNPDEIERRLSTEIEQFQRCDKYIDVVINTANPIDAVVNKTVECILEFLIGDTFFNVTEDNMFKMYCELTKDMDRYLLSSTYKSRTYMKYHGYTKNHREQECYILVIRYPGATRGVIYVNRIGQVVDIEFYPDTCYTKLKTYDISMEMLKDQYKLWSFPKSVLDKLEMERIKLNMMENEVIENE